MITNETCSTVLIRAHIKRCITPIAFILNVYAMMKMPRSFFLNRSTLNILQNWGERSYKSY